MDSIFIFFMTGLTGFTGLFYVPKNVSAARRIVFSRFHPAVASLQQAWRGRLEIVKEKKKILLILLLLSKLKF